MRVKAVSEVQIAWCRVCGFTMMCVYRCSWHHYPILSILYICIKRCHLDATQLYAHVIAIWSYNDLSGPPLHCAWKGIPPGRHFWRLASLILLDLLRMPDSRSSLSQKPGIRRGFSAAMTAWSLLYHDSKTSMLILSCLAVRNNSWPDFLAGYGQGVLHFSSKHSVPSAEGGRWWERTDWGGFLLYVIWAAVVLHFLFIQYNQYIYIINIFIYSEDSYMLSTSIHYSLVYAILELRVSNQLHPWLRTAEAAQCVDCDANRAPWIESSAFTSTGAGWCWFYTKWCWMSEKWVQWALYGLVINPILGKH